MRPEPLEETDFSEDDMLNTIRCEPGKPLLLDVRLNGKPLTMELDTGAAIHPDWESIQTVQSAAVSLSKVLEQHKAVFEDLGELKGHRAKIMVDPSTQPRYCKARPVPYALREKVEEELDRLQREGIIEPVQFAEWAAPVMPVLKQDRKSLRLCGDFKLTVNKASKLDKYPIPKIEDLFAQLAGGKSFSKLDMSPTVSTG